MAAPLLVLLPGMDGTGLMFGPLLEALGAGTEVQVPRYPAERVSYADCLDFARGACPGSGPLSCWGNPFRAPSPWPWRRKGPRG